MFSHIMIGTNDLDKAKAFYDKLLGTPANGGTIGFSCSSPEQADAWHAAGLEAGGTTCEEPPGIRQGSAGKLYLAYLRDLDGNKLCAMHRMA